MKILMRAMIVALAIVATGLPLLKFSSNTEATGSLWDLAADFRLDPNQANPSPDMSGYPNVWYYLESATLTRNPATYTLLPTFISDAFNVQGLEQWQSINTDCPPNCKNQLPAVGINATGSFQQLGTLPWPAGAMRLHPSADRLAIVGWRSPISGVVSANGGFTDLDSACGNGVRWFVDSPGGTLDGGVIPNGGSASFGLPGISVAEGDLLYFIVDPNGLREGGCDSTRLDLTISAPTTPAPTPTPSPSSPSPTPNAVGGVVELTAAGGQTGSGDWLLVTFGVTALVFGAAGAAFVGARRFRP